jgi:hypothetical protein
MDIPEGTSGYSSRWWLALLKCTSLRIRTRQQSARPGEPLDTAEDLHVKIFPLAWPEDFEE